MNRLWWLRRTLHYRFLRRELTLEEAIERAILRLRRWDRDIYLANRFEGMSYVEIAKHFCISIDAVEQVMIRALASIDRDVPNHLLE